MSRPLLKKSLPWIAVGLLLLAASVLAASWLASRPLFEERLDTASLEGFAVAPLDRALSLARFRAADGSLHLLRVQGAHGGAVHGIDLNRALDRGEDDPIVLYRRLGYAALAAAQGPELSIGFAALEIPFEARADNIGIGANYREHARESGLEEQPFVFPKFAQPTRFDAAVPRAPSRLLDYEVELGLVALDAVRPDTVAPAFGLVLANELTDRWALVRDIDRAGAMGYTGFADGKSREGFAPIGPLLVIPKDLDDFVQQLELRLYLNGRLRQLAPARDMVWPASQLPAEVFRHATTPYRYQGQAISLLGSPGHIGPATLIFSGTPAGVIFKPYNLINPWVYLQAGDEVTLSATYLGHIRNRITP